MAGGQLGIGVAGHAHGCRQARIGQVDIRDQNGSCPGAFEPPKSRAHEGLDLLRVIRRLDKNGGSLGYGQHWLCWSRHDRRGWFGGLARVGAISEFAGSFLRIRLLCADWCARASVILGIVLEANGQGRHC